MSLSKLLRKITGLNYLVTVGSKRFSNVKEYLEISDFGRDSFRGKTMSELTRGLFVLKLSTYEYFVKKSENLYGFGQKVIGRKLCNKLLKSTFYGQFVAGDSVEELEKASSYLLKHGNVKTMLCPPMEDLHGTNESFSAMAKSNTEKYMTFLNISNDLNKKMPARATVLQYKPSATFPVECFDILSDAIDKSGKGLHYYTDVIYEGIHSNKYDKIYEIVDQNTGNNLKTGLKLCKDLFQKARQLNIPIIVDAEYRSSYNAMVAFCLAFSIDHNKHDTGQPLIFATYQNYLKDATKFLKLSLDFCEKNKLFLGAKLVRGAYMLVERQRAKELGAEDPIWNSYEKTSETYNSNVALLLNKIKENPKSVSLYIASHNEESVTKAKEKMRQLGITNDCSNVTFAQIYGMCDHLSFSLGKNGYNVYKSIPWGSVDEWVPYLSRRASENYSAFQTARNEIPYYKHELKRRLKLTN